MYDIMKTLSRYIITRYLGQAELAKKHLANYFIESGGVESHVYEQTYMYRRDSFPNSPFRTLPRWIKRYIGSAPLTGGVATILLIDASSLLPKFIERHVRPGISE